MTAERYTAVFTGFFTGKKPGEYLSLTVSDEASRSEGGTLRRGRPPYEHMGREVAFEDLPEECQQRILDVYRDLWDLK